MATIQKREGKKGPSYRVMVRMKGFPMQVKTFQAPDGRQTVGAGHGKRHPQG